MSITELAQELHISPQALRKWCAKNGIQKETSAETSAKPAERKPQYILDENAVNRARAYYSERKPKRKPKGNQVRKPSEETSAETLKETLRKAEETFKETLEETSAKLKETETKLNGAEETITSLREQLHQASAGNENLKEQLTKVRADNAEKDTQIQDLTAELHQVRAEKDKQDIIIMHLREQLDQVRATNEKEIKALQDQLSEVRADKLDYKERLDRAEEQKTKTDNERQTILATLLDLRKRNNIIEVHQQSPAPSAPKQTAQEQTPSKPRTTQRREPTARKTPKKGIFTNLFNRKGR